MLQLRNAHTRAHQYIKKFRAGSSDIGLLCLNMQIEAKGATYDMQSKKIDFETWDVRHEGKRKLVPQMTNSHTRARDLIKKFIADSNDIGC